ncbi:anaerobic ribonucleoside-triphosphate reductase activating protein [Ruminococcus flavefaciens]|uniref:anaerobic ribonucleoside-triphosphate reductase activating protein n=1 Tax=Ruminococcus flavefaciens TaxID=1265 RepID=UPI0026EC5265|nr:anaerobic ribonucleoside-triphosphate reductase activating protein [Ruminococcus flavefaciens]MDD7517244.1 anaerobic ribonucleoside-triphosphate reductase activating protein [Ruminococcus flavefaciens]MDY5691259.1 anaerobic ribonucleoside-triphosphate reductase activating protein [Ruminococcus flavefaciens]
MELRIAGTVNDSIVDGPGIRFSIFVQGCPHNCEGCHNPQTHDFNGGAIFTTEELLDKVKGNPLLDGVTFSGGEPFCQAEVLAKLGKEIKALGLNIITYTGYTFEQLYENRNKNHWGELLEVTDYLIDGPFILAQKDWEIKFRGSSNQRYIDCQKSLEEGCAVETQP